MINFHRFLIGTAILFCAGFAVWAFGTYQASGRAMSLLLTASFGVAAIGLTYYLVNLKRFLGR